MPDYNNTVIYEIICKDPTVTDFYIGSTCNFRKRKYDHKHVTKTETNQDYNCPLYKCIRDHGGWENWEMLPIARVTCVDKLEKFMWERKYIKRLRPTINKSVPNRSREEYNQLPEVKEYMKEYFREYAVKKSDQIKKKKDEYYKKIKDEIEELKQNEQVKELVEVKELTKKQQYTKAYNEKYRSLNREVLKEKNRKRYEENREQIKLYYKKYREQRSEKVQCECGSFVCLYRLPGHKRTYKHINFVKEKK